MKAFDQRAQSVRKQLPEVKVAMGPQDINCNLGQALSRVTGATEGQQPLLVVGMSWIACMFGLGHSISVTDRGRTVSDR